VKQNIKNSVGLRSHVQGRFALSASIIALAALAPASAFAQDAASASEEAAANEPGIVVQGIRAQVESSQNIKKNADTFVDAVTADDIGALPDKSVTEALQRIPGVTINRFQGADDPLHFSVEGANVVIRGLNYVRSEFNGREAFSVNSGRALSFSDVSPELLSSVQVFKNGTPDRIDGGISGLVDLRTRKPFDSRKLIIAGTAEALYGDITKKWTPSFSGLLSNVFETGIGDIGVLVSYGQSQLKSTAYGTQIDETIFRPDLSVITPASGATPANVTTARYAPRGAGVRVQEFNRKRNTFDASLQWEAVDGSAMLTLEYIRATAGQKWGENTAEIDNFDRGPTVNIINGTFDANGILETGEIRSTGLPFSITKRNQNSKNKNEDFSANLVLRPTDRLKFTFDGQYARARTQQFDIGLLGSVDTQVSAIIDRTNGNIPSVVFNVSDTVLAPGTAADRQSRVNAYFSNPANVFYRAVLDHVEKSEGDLSAFTADVDYDFDDGFLRKLKAGARYSDREQIRRYSAYAWGFVSQNWTGAGLSPYSSPNPVGNIVENDFSNFQRGSVATPITTLYTDLDVAAAYRNGTFQSQLTPLIRAGCCAGNVTRFLRGRDGTTLLGANGDPLSPDVPSVSAPTGTPAANRSFFTPGELNRSREETFSAYLRADYEIDGIFGEGTALNGNFGVRYVNTKFATFGTIAFPAVDTQPTVLTSTVNGVTTTQTLPALQQPTGPSTFGVPTAAAVATKCAAIIANGIANAAPGSTPSRAPFYCFLSPAQQTEFFTLLNGGSAPIVLKNDYDYFLPSFNANLKLSDELFIRFAIQRAISRPDFGITAFSTNIGGNDAAIGLNSNTLTPGLPIFGGGGGDPRLEAVKATNIDLGVEYYFGKTSSITLNAFYKKLEDIIAGGDSVETFSNNGLTVPVQFGGPANVGKGNVKGFEIGYSQFYDFLPGVLGGLGFQGNFTYVKPSTFPVQVTERQYAGLRYPLAGLSKYTFNASLLYEKYGISARATYNWRSQYLLTPRDVIIPYAPIYVPDGGQLDASLFYAVTPNIKIGVQATNLLDQVTETLQQTTFDQTGIAPGSNQYTASFGPRAPRSFFTNDRRFSFGVRFNF
jgi:TonB-dependent receptor